MRNIRRYRVAYLLFPIVLLFIQSTQTFAKDQQPLIFAIHPYLSANEIKKRFTPLANYLAQQIGRNIEVKVGSSYEQHVRIIGMDRADIAYLGPTLYVEMVEEFGRKPLLARVEVNGKPTFQGAVIVRKDSPVHRIEDLRGKRIAYGDPNSTMSYIVPDFMLHNAGVFNDSNSQHEFLYSHHNVAMAVLAGDFDAGAVKPAVFREYEKQGLRRIAKTPEISEHLFVSSNKLPAKLVNKLRTAMLKMSNTDRGLAVLRSIKKDVSGLVTVRDSDYENLVNILKLNRERH